MKSVVLVAFLLAVEFVAAQSAPPYSRAVDDCVSQLKDDIHAVMALKQVLDRSQFGEGLQLLIQKLPMIEKTPKTCEGITHQDISAFAIQKLTVQQQVCLRSFQYSFIPKVLTVVHEQKQRNWDDAIRSIHTVVDYVHQLSLACPPSIATGIFAH